MNKNLKSKLLPVSLSVIIVILDQLTKWLVVKNIAVRTQVISIFGKYVQLIHVRNKGVAFSFMDGLPDTARSLILGIIPLIIIVLIYFFMFKGNEFTNFQRWVICGILGGGIGNIIDRLFRPDGVVDFISCYFFGIFGMEYWPTFNVADCAVVVCGILFLISFIFQSKSKVENQAEKDESSAN